MPYQTRPLANAAALNDEASGDAILTFASVSHPLLGTPMRVVADHLPYVWRGHEWSPVLFEFETVQDDDRAPQARIVLPAIDRRIARALLALPERARISVWALSASDFDLSVEPRVPLDDPVPLMDLLNYDLVEVQGTVSEAQGTLVLRDYTQEPAQLRATESRFPGLFA